MVFGEISIKDKLGRMVVLRNARPEDFEKFGTFPDNMKYSDGSYMDAYWMMRRL